MLSAVSKTHDIESGYMSGAISDLAILLASMQPRLNPARVGYWQGTSLADALALFSETAVIGSFRETEGLTLIIDLDHPATSGLETSPPMAWITLDVNSDLAAIGLTAAFASALGNAGISCNVIAALFHDHILVPEADGERAVKVLRDLQENGKK